MYGSGGVSAETGHQKGAGGVVRVGRHPDGALRCGAAGLAAVAGSGSQRAVPAATKGHPCGCAVRGGDVHRRAPARFGAAQASHAHPCRAFRHRMHPGMRAYRRVLPVVRAAHDGGGWR